jgi:hypothetical protein
MKNFNAPLKMTHIHSRIRQERELYEVERTLIYDNGIARVVVPRRYVCDLGSLPRSMWWFYSPSGRGQEAFVIHDFLYDTQMGGERRIADAIMSSALKDLGVKFYHRFAMYLAVRLFGPRFKTFAAIDDLQLLRELKMRGIRGTEKEKSFIEKWGKTEIKNGNTNET